MNLQIFILSRRSKRRQLVGLLLPLLVELALLPQSQGANPYLPNIGPVPMCFEPTTPPDAVVTWKPLLLPAMAPVVKTTNTPTPPVVALTKANDTNDVVEYKAASTPATNPVPTVATQDNPTTEPSPAYMVLPVESEPNHLSGPVTPQSLAEYFKPGRGGKNRNNTSLFLPLDVDFTPPTPTTTHESRATYKVE